MKCKLYKEKLFILNELDLEEKEELQKHISLCENCQKEAAKHVEFHEIIQRKLSIEPALKSPVDLTNSIMGSLMENSGSQVIKNKVPFLRIILSSAAALLLGLFIFQQAYITYNLSKIERKVNSIENRDVNFHEKKNLQESYTVSVKGSKQISISKEDLDDFIKAYSELKNEYDILFKLVEERYPALAKEIKNTSELRKILKNKRALNNKFKES